MYYDVIVLLVTPYFDYLIATQKGAINFHIIYWRENDVSKIYGIGLKYVCA